MRKRIVEIADVRMGYQFRHKLEPDPASEYFATPPSHDLPPTSMSSF